MGAVNFSLLDWRGIRCHGLFNRDLYLVLPITTFIISIFIGKDDGWANHRWSMLLFFGFMYMVASYATFSLSNMLSFEKVNAPELEGMLPGILSAGLGMFVGSVIRLFVEKRKK